ncbi:gelsolin, cytoplasmic isoform X2 [Neocloeon triangulifer]|uniref:gelsolin, cytoplasmic isoform X2 n=1 Tax=Neocloeon triangulifer TaxID=2078957 RepID=UPI00286F72B9|nr:gelsolin, cytoplasmic isoform X2 [Neocloeon triangulifer]
MSVRTIGAAPTSRRWASLLFVFAVAVCCWGSSSALTISPTETTPRPRMATHQAFGNAGKTAGLEIWRIESFQPKPYPKKDYGKFYSGDSYIVLFTKENKGAFSWDIHFWLGNETSQDEAGAAAIMSVELDDALGGAPVQYREVQDHESQLFLSHFPSGVRYMPGGVASGFHHVDKDKVEKRFFQVKGRRNVRVRQIPLGISTMNKGDCFILDVTKEIFVYCGMNSKRQERLKAIQAAGQIRDQDHGGRPKVNIIDNFSGDSEVQKYFQELGGGSRAEVPPESTGGDDDAFEKAQDTKVALFKVSDASGTMKVEKVGEKPLNQNLLQSAPEGGAQDCFILDTVTSGIFVWIGRSCNKNEKNEALKKADQFLKDNKYPAWTSVQRIVEDGEPVAFKQYFTTWREKRVGRSIGSGRVYDMKQISEAMPEADFNPASLHAEKVMRLLAKSSGRAFGFMPDDGKGKVEVFRVENFELAPVTKTTPGFFFGGDSYVIKYTYLKGNKENCVIYFWQGKDSSQDEKAASALHAVRLDNELGGRATQVRVVQGNEPRHFLRIFQGRMVIFMGGHASGFKNVRDHDTYDTDGVMLFQVRGTCPDDVRAEQVEEKTQSLNSDDAFYLVTNKDDFLWFGKDSSPEERDMARNISKLMVEPGMQVIEVEEGAEPEEFWKVLGGKGPYTSEPKEDDRPLLAPRLFHCYIPENGGKLKVEEVDDYTQEDLNEEDVMVLDAGDEIYIWIGKDSSKSEREQSLKMAEEYLKTDPTDRNHDKALIFTLRQGHEDKSFTSLFPSWDDNMWTSLKSYEVLRKEAQD